MKLSASSKAHPSYKLLSFLIRHMKYNTLEEIVKQRKNSIK